MKVLWFTTSPMPEMLGQSPSDHAGTGSWVVALLQALATVPGMNIAVACAGRGLSNTEINVSENIRFYPISQGRAIPIFHFRKPDNDPRYLEACSQIAKKVAPDIIHIHGTERFYGLLGARKLVSAPCVISLQGILQEYSKHHLYFGAVSLGSLLRHPDPLHLLRGSGPVCDYFHICRAAKREVEILKGNRYYMGRTLWDRAHLRAINTNARYFHVPELLRTGFYQKQWNLDSCRRHRVLFTNANTFSRGTEILIEAIAILKRQFLDVTLALAGGVEQLSYGKHLREMITRLGLSNAVEFLGRLNQQQIVDQLCQSHVFAIASYLENSSNSLCEAQLVGLPCVASYVGGTPSLVEGGKTGLLFPSGDAAVLAEQIADVFNNDDLAGRLGNNARESALQRHSPDVVVRTLVNTYNTIISEAGKQ
ncbi:MAG: glycosyltransferase family 4 protein [Planctomycetota bacterium]